MKLKVMNMAGKSAGSIEVSDAVFGCEYNEALIHQVVVSQLANKRQGTMSALTRSEVRGLTVRRVRVVRVRAASFRPSSPAAAWCSRRSPAISPRKSTRI